MVDGSELMNESPRFVCTAIEIKNQINSYKIFIMNLSLRMKVLGDAGNVLLQSKMKIRSGK